MKGFKGVVVFFKDIQYGWVVCSNYDDMDHYESLSLADRIYLGHVEVDVEFEDPTAKEVEALQAIQATMREKHITEMQHMDEKIQSLLAIGHESGEE